ncbi:MAG: sulfotransferase, partial [bacterium]|nr:sulfotransferase [bacterium]
MALKWKSPQEDEVALANLGMPSSFLTIVFPNRPPQDPEYIDLESLSPAKRERWKKTVKRFYQHLTYLQPGRLILKSPQHTWRLKILLEMFPNARFVHMVRDPFIVFPSTVHFWKTMYLLHGLQTPNFKTLNEYEFENLLSMNRKL